MKRISLLLAFTILMASCIGACKKPFSFKKQKETRHSIEVLQDPYYEKIVRLDGNGDGLIDEIRYFHAGVCIMIEFDYDQDGSIDEVRHYNGQRLTRANNLPANWTYTGYDTRPESILNLDQNSDVPDPSKLPDATIEKPWDDPGMDSATKDPVIVQPVAPETKTGPEVIANPVIEDPGAATTSDNTTKVDIETALTEPLPGNPPKNLYAIERNHDSQNTEDAHDFVLTSTFSKYQNFYISGTADLADGSTVNVRAKHKATLIFSTNITVKNGRFEKFISGWNRQLGAGVYTVFAEFQKKSARNAALYKGDQGTEEILKSECSLELIRVSEKELEQIYATRETAASAPIVAQQDTPKTPERSTPALQPVAQPTTEPAPQPEPSRLADNPEPANDPDIILADLDPKLIGISVPTQPIAKPMSKLGNYQMNSAITLASNQGTRVIKVTGTSNLPDQSQLVINLLFNNNLVLQHIALLNDGQFVWTHKLQPNITPRYGIYTAFVEFDLELQEKEIQDLFFVKKGQVFGQSSYQYGSKRMAVDEASRHLISYRSFYRELKSYFSKAQWELEKQSDTLKIDTWNDLANKTFNRLEEISSELKTENSTAFATYFPQLNANLRLCANSIVAFLNVSGLQLAQIHNLDESTIPGADQLTKKERDFNRVEKRIKVALKNIQEEIKRIEKGK